MAIKTVTKMLPEHLLCYFHYGETEGLEEKDLEILDQFDREMQQEYGSFVIMSDDEETRNFVRYHDLQKYGWLADSCVEMTFSVEKGV